MNLQYLITKLFYGFLSLQFFIINLNLARNSPYNCIFKQRLKFPQHLHHMSSKQKEFHIFDSFGQKTSEQHKYIKGLVTTYAINKNLTFPGKALLTHTRFKLRMSTSFDCLVLRPLRSPLLQKCSLR